MMTSLQGASSAKNLAEYAGEDRVLSAHEISLTFQEKESWVINAMSGINEQTFWVAMDASKRMKGTLEILEAMV
jgi:hypothetical protein